MSFKIVILLVVLFISNELINAQSCGFGCLGLSGVYGGYSQETYKLDDLNSILNQTHSVLTASSVCDEVFKFEKLKGYRVGANIFRAKFSSFFITAKGYYQFLQETQASESETLDGKSLMETELDLSHWGFGLDVGFPVFSFLNLKLVDGGINLYTSQLKITYGGTTETNFKYASMDMGYYIGSGVIIELIKNYVSLEGTAYYQTIKIDNLIDDDGNKFPSATDGTKFVNEGGFSASVQLNVGISF